MIKEEIKSFLANRRISQAVVAQVTGQSELHPHPYKRTLRVSASHLVESQDPETQTEDPAHCSSLHMAHLHAGILGHSPPVEKRCSR